MSRVFRSAGFDSLPKAVSNTVLDPDIALGLVSIPEGFNPDFLMVVQQLGLNAVKEELNANWSETGYQGEVDTFRFAHAVEAGSSPHIDQKRGTGARSPARVAVLSIPDYGTADIYGQQYDSVLEPGVFKPTERYNQELEAMRSEVKSLSISGMPLYVKHYPNQILIIPTLVRPTAHAVVLPYGARRTRLFDCALFD